MAHKIKTLSVTGMFLSLLWLAACATPTPTIAPTLDLNPLRTEVAATVLAQVTRAVLLTPSATPLPSPTVTTLPTSTPLQAASATPSATTAPTTGATAAASPAATAKPSTGTPGVATENRAQWVSQTIADDTTFKPGETFTMTWRLKNVGTSTWKPEYMLRYYSGDTFGAPKEVLLGRDVAPGEMVDITLRMRAPIRTGSYRSDWVMSSEIRSNFKEPVYLMIKVALPPTPTRAP